jgi:hypothetical protein
VLASTTISSVQLSSTLNYDYTTQAVDFVLQVRLLSSLPLPCTSSNSCTAQLSQPDAKVVVTLAHVYMVADATAVASCTMAPGKRQSARVRARATERVRQVCTCRRLHRRRQAHQWQPWCAARVSRVVTVHVIGAVRCRQRALQRAVRTGERVRRCVARTTSLRARVRQQYFEKQCSCNALGQLSALCVERDSTLTTATCVSALDLGERCTTASVRCAPRADTLTALCTDVWRRVR